MEQAISKELDLVKLPLFGDQLYNPLLVNLILATMADPHIQAKSTTDEATRDLIAAQDKFLKDVPVNKILSAGFSNQYDLIDKLATMAIANDLLPNDEREDFEDLVQKNRNLVDSIQLQTLYASKEDSGLESYSDPDALIVPIYEEGAPPLITSVSDTQVKNIPTLTCEDHVGSDLDAHIESFLSTVFTVAKQLNLSHKCCADVIQRKLQKTSRTIFEAWLSTNDLRSGQVELHVLCHFLEHTFCLYSSERAVNLQLANLQKIKNAQYLQAIGKISKLCRLAVRHIKDKAQRELIERTKAIECFRAICSDNDKAFLVAEDRLRAEQHKLPLTIHKAGQLLAQRHADSVQNTIANSDTALSSNRVLDSYQYEDIEDGNVVETEQANFAYRGRGRGRYQSRGRPFMARAMNSPRPFNPNYYKSRYPARDNPRFPPSFPRQGAPPEAHRYPNPQYTSRPRFSSRGRGAPQRFPTNRGGGRPYPPRNVPDRPKFGPERRPHITPESLGIQPGLCLFCLDPHHRYYDEKCPYFGRSQLQTSNCDNCLALGKRTGHSHRSCLEPKALRVRQDHNADDDESVFHFLDTFSTSKNDFYPPQ